MPSNKSHQNIVLTLLWLALVAIDDLALPSASLLFLSTPPLPNEHTAILVSLSDMLEA